VICLSRSDRKTWRAERVDIEGRLVYHLRRMDGGSA